MASGQDRLALVTATESRLRGGDEATPSNLSPVAGQCGALDRKTRPTIANVTLSIEPDQAAS